MSKIYLPNELINNSYNYEYSNDTIIIHKNINCDINNFCDCQNVYIDFGYNLSENYKCSNNNVILLNNDDLVDDFYYRNDIVSILIIFLILFIFIILFPFKIVSRLFGRWFKI